MAEIDSYSALKQAVIDYSDTENNPAVTKYLNAFLRNVESKVRKRLRISNQEFGATLTAEEGKNAYSLPPKLLSLRIVKYKSPPPKSGEDTSYWTLKYRPPHAITNMRQQFFGTVEYYTLEHQQLIVLGGVETGGTLGLTYYEGIPALTDANPSNWLLADYPDIYLSGCMVEVSRLQKMADTPQSQVDWQKDFNNELSALEVADKRDRWSGPPQVSVPAIRW